MKVRFYFAVGIFSLYFVLTGKRALRFKGKTPDLRIDIWVSRVMIASGVLMILLPIILVQRINIVLLVFAIVGITLAIRDLILYRNTKRLKGGWLKLHLGKMTGGYISAFTAFVVVNEFFPSVYSWFVPGIMGGFFITFWFRKLNGKKIAQPKLK